ncbi:MAG: mechanosensitive ion channel, partial [Anaerolineae bacterium]
PGAYWDVIWKLVSSLLVLLLTLVGGRAIDRLLKARLKETSHSHTLRMLLRNTIFIGGAVAILAIWLGVGSSFAVAMGILGAGIAFASQEVIGSLAGYVNIVSGSLYRIGDRVRIGEVTGDVLDITLLRTTVMEIGGWVNADQYTGRVVTVANRMIFAAPVYNYTHQWDYLWDEVMIPVTYGSDWRRAAEIMLAHGQEYSLEIQPQAKADLDDMMRKYPVLHETGLEPTLYVVMTDNWVEMTLRYVVAARDRRAVKGELHRELLEHFQEEEAITVASTTVEIVGFPPLRGDEG